MREKNQKLTKKQKARTWSVVSTLIVLLIIAILVSFALGRYSLSLSEMWKVIAHYVFRQPATYEAASETVLINVRLPRIIAGVCIGGALAIAGATYQGLFQNPMVSPDLLGSSSGACFGACISLLFNAHSLTVELVSFACGLLAVFITYTVSNAVSRGSVNTLSLVLTGMVVSSLFSSGMTMVQYVADPDSKLAEISFWLMGSLTSFTRKDIPLLVIPVVAGIIPILLLRYRLNVLAFGEEEAKAMGVNTRRLRLIFIICSTLITSAAVAVSGMIGWVGLVIPHIARMLVGPNHKVLIPVSLLLGSIYLLLIDNICRCAFAVEIPIGILTSVIGAPFFIYLLVRGKKGWV